MQMLKRSFSGVMAVLAFTAATGVWAHGDVTPQPVDITGLEPIENPAVWLDTNPYSGNEKAIEIGHHAFAQNCARCHGIDAVSGGIAPDLRENLPLGEEGDEIFKERMINGAVRNGVTYMPKFEGLIAQEGLWAIRSWLESVSVDAPPKDKAKTDEAKTDETKTDAAKSDNAAATAASKTAESK
ncbi:MAG: cytochrome c-550 PedF [Candidatus Thiothrix singaporensis]|uniref:Cytochrome c-550 PedF n=1 Tax=Candidatus Thiothrix singaporensis TaxID=2799669 RepID=A0A7L6AXR4_9GAMM|nr:MAG: cytochrome c-550 PedF [Candidatus Thiothrix singaporensis]